MKLLDYHIHSDNSPDGKDSFHKIVESAILRNLEEICVTDHYEIGGAWESFYNPTRFFQDHLRADNMFHELINIRAGVEVGNPCTAPDKVNEVLDAFPYDFVLASLHDVGGCDLAVKDYKKENIDELLKEYFDGIHAIIDFGNFDCLGHLDLPKRYMARQGLELDIYKQYPLELNELLMHLKEADKGLEVNVSGLRTDMGKMMPDMNVLRMWYACGGRKITIGSDAHKSDDVGKFIEEGIDMIRECGFTHIATYEKRKLKYQPLEYTVYD
ncbi:MAG: histidinol-phosphatase HisJ family protein [Clostridiales bacterium]|jgi:histidinol-phosphatase (PHP family)|nr:histidinol-phosphatase HisJ family protein [Clostridiales bacterium]